MRYKALRMPLRRQILPENSVLRFYNMMRGYASIMDDRCAPQSPCYTGTPIRSDPKTNKEPTLAHSRVRFVFGRIRHIRYRHWRFSLLLKVAAQELPNFWCLVLTSRHDSRASTHKHTSTGVVWPCPHTSDTESEHHAG